MLGAILGDIAGSKYEFRNIRTKEFDLFGRGCDITDDTFMTVAIGEAVMESREERARGGKKPFSEFVVEKMQKYGRLYPNPMGAYGASFREWIASPHPVPYNSCGNGSAMRVSACGMVAVNMPEAITLARISAAVTHNHPEGIKGAEAVAAAIFLAKTGRSKEEIRRFIEDNYYSLDLDVDSLRKTYRFDATCQGTVPQAIVAFLQSDGFEDALRTSVSIGGDSDTVAAITGSIAWAFYRRRGVRSFVDMPEELEMLVQRASHLIPQEFIDLDRELWELYLGRAGSCSRGAGCVAIVTKAEAEQEQEAIFSRKNMPKVYDEYGGSSIPLYAPAM